MNNDGVIIGFALTAEYNRHAVRWDQTGRITDLGALPGDFNSISYVINDAGIVGGASDAPGANRPYAVRWDRSGQITALATASGSSGSDVTAINDAGTLVGFAYVNDWPPRAARWDSAGHLTDLGSLFGISGDSWAVDINNRGTIIGNSRQPGSFEHHATRWDRTGAMVGLPALPGTSGESSAIAINDTGAIVGWSRTESNEETTHAVLWRH